MEFTLNRILYQDTSRRNLLKYGIFAGISTLTGIRGLNTDATLPNISAPLQSYKGILLDYTSKPYNIFIVSENIQRDMLIFSSVDNIQDIPWAYFDNSCFIKGTSQGIFMQDNEKVSKSFIEVMVDYFDVISISDVDKKMGKYLLAYCNVINYFYQLSKLNNNDIDKINILYESATHILSQLGMSFGKGIIKHVKEKPDEKSYIINGNHYIQTDNFFMKDFVIQLKYVGESNYKYYNLQEEQQKGMQIKKKKVITQNFANENDKEILLLLGSLIYDENWFKSTIDNENQEM